NLPPAGGAPRASAESGGTATEVDTETDTTETLKLEAFAITPNGTYAAAKVGKTLHVWNVSSGDQVGVAELGCQVAIDPSGIDLDTPCNERNLGSVIDLQISPDGAWIIVVGQSAAELFHRTKDALVPAPVPAGGTAHCRLKPDDELYSYERSRLGFSAAFSGNSSVLAVGRGRSIDTWRLDGTAPTRIETICANAESLALDFGGTWLARRNDIERSRCYYETTKPCGFFLYVLRDDRWIGFSSQHIRAFDSHQAGVALEPSKIGFSRTDLAAHSSSPVRTSCDYDSYFLSQGTAVSASSCGYVVDDGKSVIAGVLPLGTTLAVAPLARVVADADDGTVRIWKLSRSLENVVQTTADATPLAKTSIAPGGVWSGTIAVARDGLTLAIGSSDTASDSREQIVDGKPPVLALFSTVESAEKTELVRTSGEMPQLLDKNGNHGVAYVDFDPAQERVYSLGRDGHVRIWRRSDGSKLLDLGNEQGRILAAGFTPDGSKIATGDHVGRLCAWNSATGQKLACSEPTNVALRRGAFAMTPAGAFITTDVKGTIRLWKLGAEAPIVVGNHALAVDRLEVDKTGKWLASASNDGTARLWDLTTCAPSGCKESLRLEDPSGFDDVLLPSDNGTTWLIATPHDDRVVVVDLAKPAERHVLTTRNWASSVDVSRPGHLLLCEFGGTVEEWDLRTKRLSGRLLPSDDRAWCGAKYVGENRFITQFTNGEVALWSIDALARGLTGWSTMGGLSFDASGAIVGTPRLSSGARDVLVMSRDGNVTARVPAVSRAVVDDKAIIFGTPNGGIGVVDAAGNGALSSGTDYVASTIAASHGERLVVTWDLHYELAPSASVQAPVWRALPSSLPHGSVRDARLAAGSWIVAAAQDDSVTRYDATGHRNDTSTLKGAAHVVEADNGDGLLVVGDFDVATIGATGPPVVHKMMSGVYSRAAAWDVGASLLALASRNNVVEIRDLSTNKVLWSESKTFGTDKYYAQLIKFGTVGTQRVIALATEGYIGIYAVATGKLVQEFLEKTKQKGDVLDLWFLEDGNLLTHDDAARLVLWDSRTGKQLEMLQDINDVVLGPGNRFLVTRWGEMRYVTYKNKKLDLSDPHLDCGRYVYRIASSATGKLFAAASQPKNETDSAQLCLIDAATGRVVTTWSSKQTQITRLAFRRDDTALLSIADEPAPVLWEVPTGKQLQVFEHEDLLVAGFAKGTPYIVTADTSGKLRIYDARAGRMVAESTQPPGAVQVVSSGLIDETSGILTTTDARGVIVQIDLATGRRLREFSTQRREIRAIAVAPGGSTIAAAVGSEVQLWRNAPGLLVPVALPPITLDTGEVDGLSFSPDGRWLAAADGFSVENTEAEHGLLTLWDASDGSNLLRKDTPVRLTSVAWSNDAREVVVAGNAGYLQVVSFGLEQRPVEVVRKILERMAPRTTYHPTQSPRKPSTSGGGMIDI
ncbi:MAG TPA: WD40 repeat domain-containing protein, partial [Kofleriaceae bacterium]|nr:WD40 repeat domain-containing protein [Kofleriaceae bacterium]